MGRGKDRQGSGRPCRGNRPRYSVLRTQYSSSGGGTEASAVRPEDSGLGTPRLTAASPAAVAPPPAPHSALRTPKFSVLCRSVEQLDTLLGWSPTTEVAKPSVVYLDFEEVRQSKRGVAMCREAEIEVALATPRIIKPGEEGLLLQIANCAPDGVLVRNLAAVSFYRARFSDLTLYGDYALNVADELTAHLFAESGLARLTPSYDLNLSQLEAMLGRIDPALFEVVLHQHIPMFHMEHCVFSHVLSNGKDFHDCGRPCDRHRVELRDHVGESHPLVADVGCRNTVYSARAQSAAALTSPG